MKYCGSGAKTLYPGKLRVRGSRPGTLVAPKTSVTLISGQMTVLAGLIAPELSHNVLRIV